MSVAALERWRSSLQDFSSYQSPSATATRLTRSPRLARTLNLTPSDRFGHRQSSHSHNASPACVAKKKNEFQDRVSKEVKGEDASVAPPKMHAQVTPDTLAVSTIEDVSTTQRCSPETLCLNPDQLLCNADTTTSYTISSRLSTTPNSSDTHQYFDFNSPCTAPEANSCADASLDSFSPPQNSNLWNGKSLSKCNTNSRGSLTCKGKGVCCGRRRLLDEEGYIRRAACICVNKEETEVLLVTSKKDPCVWLVPGGGLESGEEPITAAHREAWEEAGVQGVVRRFLGLFESYHHSGTKKHRTAVFVFVVTKEHKDFPEARLGRRRRWFNLEEALLLLARHRPLQSTYLQLLTMSKLKMATAS